jgi:hypothetical protein
VNRAASVSLLLCLAVVVLGYVAPGLLPLAGLGAYASYGCFASVVALQISGAMSASGAFEVTVFDEGGMAGKKRVVFSKLATGKYPSSIDHLHHAIISGDAGVRGPSAE